MKSEYGRKIVSTGRKERERSAQTWNSLSQLDISLHPLGHGGGTLLGSEAKREGRVHLGLDQLRLVSARLQHR